MFDGPYQSLGLNFGWTIARRHFPFMVFSIVRSFEALLLLLQRFERTDI